MRRQEAARIAEEASAIERLFARQQANIQYKTIISTRFCEPSYANLVQDTGVSALSKPSDC